MQVVYSHVLDDFMLQISVIIQHSFFVSDSNAPVRQTACLCLLKLVRIDPHVIPIEKHAQKIIRFLSDKNLVRLMTCLIIDEHVCG